MRHGKVPQKIKKLLPYFFIFVLICFFCSCSSNLTDTPLDEIIPSSSSITNITSTFHNSTTEESSPPPTTYSPGNATIAENSAIVTGVEINLDDQQTLKVDIQLPFLNSTLPNAEEFNNRIRNEFKYVIASTDLDDWMTVEDYNYTWIRYNYHVAEFNGIYSIAIHSSTSSAYGSYYPSEFVWSYYYDSTNGKMLNREEFIHSIGSSKEKIIDAYITTCCPARDSKEINFEQILFYHDEHQELHFLFDITSLYPEYVPSEVS